MMPLLNAYEYREIMKKTSHVLHKGILLAALLCALQFGLACAPGIVDAPPVTEVSASPTPSAAPTTPQPIATPAPTAAPVPTATPLPTPFSFVWIADTQVYAYKYSDCFVTMTQWAVDTKEEYNTLAVLHTGDIVDNHKSSRQWANVTPAIELLKGQLPFYCVAGNHDVGAERQNFKRYLARDFCDVRDPEYLFEDGKCWALPFTAGGTDFLLLGLSWLESDDHLDWAKEILDTHTDRVVILMTHGFLTTGGMLLGNGGRIEREILQNYPAVRLVICGHKDGSVRIEIPREDAPPVHAMMYNFQEAVKHRRGLGYLRLLTFDPITRSLSVTTYSPYLDDYNFKREKDETFVIENAF